MLRVPAFHLKWSAVKVTVQARIQSLTETRTISLKYARRCSWYVRDQNEVRKSCRPGKRSALAVHNLRIWTIEISWDEQTIFSSSPISNNEPQLENTLPQRYCSSWKFSVATAQISIVKTGTAFSDCHAYSLYICYVASTQRKSKLTQTLGKQVERS